jgi:HAMP domain-containing protein
MDWIGQVEPGALLLGLLLLWGRLEHRLTRLEDKVDLLEKGQPEQEPEAPVKVLPRRQLPRAYPPP